MGFERLLLEEMKNEGFGSSRYWAGSKERAHSSKSAIDSNSNSVQIGVYETRRADYIGWKGERYLVAEGVGYDLLLSIYEANCARLVALRAYNGKGFDRKCVLGMIKRISSPKPKMEARMIGMQNNDPVAPLRQIAEFLIGNGIPVVEADLFGVEIRNIAIDLKTGTSYNVLLQDRSYRPGELANALTREDFERSAMGAAKKTV